MPINKLSQESAGRLEEAPGNIHKTIRVMLNALNGTHENWSLNRESEKSLPYSRTEIMQKLFLSYKQTESQKQMADVILENLVGIGILEKVEPPRVSSQGVANNKTITKYQVNITKLKTFEKHN